MRDARGIAHVDLVSGHAGAGLRRLEQGRLTAPGDDHLVAQGVKGLGEALPDPRAAAGDEDGVAGHFHGASPAAVVSDRSCPGRLQVRAFRIRPKA